MPGVKAIFSVRGGDGKDIQFNPGPVCIQRIVSDGRGIGVINLTSFPVLHDLIEGSSNQDALGHRNPEYT